MKVARVHTDEGFFTAVLGEPGRKFTPFVMIDFPVRKRQMLNVDVDKHAPQLMLGKKDYPVKRAARHMLRIGRAQGITKGAKVLLREAVK